MQTITVEMTVRQIQGGDNQPTETTIATKRIPEMILGSPEPAVYGELTIVGARLQINQRVKVELTILD